MIDWQFGVVLLVIGLALGYLAWAGFCSWRNSRSGCSGGCGCSRQAAASHETKSSSLIPLGDMRLRKTE